MKKKRPKWCKVAPGNELRGFMIRMYPDLDTERKLKSLEADLRYAWNWLVSQTDEVREIRAGYAVKQGLVGPKPEHPNYDGMSPDESKNAKKQYIDQCVEWRAQVKEATDKLPECSWRGIDVWKKHLGFDHDYQLLTRVIDWWYERKVRVRKIEPNAWTLQALAHNYYQPSVRRKKRRRMQDPMPLQSRSGVCFEVGDFGSRGATHANATGTTFYNCLVTFNGLRIRGRLPGKLPEGRVIEGVSITRKADGWWASIKQEVTVRRLPPAIPGTVVGIDVGLDIIAAISEVRTQDGVVVREASRVENDRCKAYAERIAGRQAQGKEVGRLQLQASRHVRHKLYNEVVKPLAQVDTIKIEQLVSTIGQMGSSKTSSMRTVRSMLLERYGSRDEKGAYAPGNRVREVLPHYTSQDCSQCGFRSKETWSYDHGRIGYCPQCGHREDRDLNAARNVASRPAIPLGK